MVRHNSKKSVPRALAFVFVMALSAPAIGQSLVELSLIIGLMGDNTKVTYEICGSNVSMEPQTATFNFTPTSPYVSPVQIELKLDPNETACQALTPTVAGILSERIKIPEDISMGGQTDGNTKIRPLTTLKDMAALSNRGIVTQVWLTDNGRRTAAVPVVNHLKAKAALSSD